MKRLFLFSILFSCLPLLRAQETGAVQCKPGSDQVPVWIEPHGVHIVATLNCGQKVNILGIASGYAKIRISETVYGYVAME